MAVPIMLALGMTDIGGGPIPTVAGQAMNAISHPGRAHFVPDIDDLDDLDVGGTRLDERS